MILSNAFLAHISEDKREQTILAHLQGTSALAKEFARRFGGEDQAQLAGMAHDIGKYSSAFQKRLRGDPQMVDHATAGAYECGLLGQIFAAFAVAGHHGGLPDGGTQADGSDDATFRGRMKRLECGKLAPYSAWKEEVQLPIAAVPAYAQTDLAHGMFFTRMLYSCLVDADYLDTEAFMTGQPRPSYPISIEQLWAKLQQYISGWFPPRGVLNEQRCAILKRCIQKGESCKPGLFSLTVPTGGGKTVASLAFALAHARTHGLRRVIYVIPYTSIIEQTAGVFREILGEDAVLEHHSNVLYDIGTAGEANVQTIRMAKATENWDMPVVVTTAVQFFESLYACQSSKCRKLHNIAGSVVIFDEAQMMPIPYLRPCVYAISQLVKNYGVSAVLCTATQPALDPIFHEFLPQQPITELCPPDTCQWEVFRRVTFQKRDSLTWDELAAQLNESRQVLCIVNTRKAAQEIYERLNRDGSFHLSTLMYPSHRKQQLVEIRRRLEKGLPCRVVSTSLIEAGVDVDFPAVWREEAGLDSILQAAGRCNREGKFSPVESVVSIFRGEGKNPELFSMPIGAGRDVMMHHKDIASPEAIHDYFYQLLVLKGKQAQDSQNILPLLEDGTLPFRTVAQRFHLIDTPTRTVYIPLEGGEMLVERLRQGERSRSLFRQLGQYGVSVYEQHYRALEQAGDLEVLEDGSAVLWNTERYSEQTGLSLTADDGKFLNI